MADMTALGDLTAFGPRTRLNYKEDFGWRSNHVVTLIAKAITTHYYEKPIKYSYIGGL
jgi:hypothetical protein